MWTATSVQRLCEKRVYRGEAYRYVDQDVDGRGAIVNRGGSSGAGHRGGVAGGADDTPDHAERDQWLSALALLADSLSGCRYAMSPGRGPKGERMYRCRSKHASGKCPRPSQILADVIEEYVEETVLTEIDGITKIVPDSAERDRVAVELSQARTDLEDFKRDRAARRKLGADWHEWLDTYLSAVRDLELELEKIDQRIGIVREGLTRKHYLDLPVSDRREVLAGFIDCLFVRRSRGRGRNVDPIESGLACSGADRLPRIFPAAGSSM